MTEFKITANEDEYDELMKIQRAIVADNAISCLSDIMSELRTIIKYEETSEETNDRFWKFRESVIELMDGQGINLDKLWS